MKKACADGRATGWLYVLLGFAIGFLWAVTGNAQTMSQFDQVNLFPVRATTEAIRGRPTRVMMTFSIYFPVDEDRYVPIRENLAELLSQAPEIRSPKGLQVRVLKNACTVKELVVATRRGLARVSGGWVETEIEVTPGKSVTEGWHSLTVAFPMIDLAKEMLKAKGPVSRAEVTVSVQVWASVEVKLAAERRAEEERRRREQAAADARRLAEARAQARTDKVWGVAGVLGGLLLLTGPILYGLGRKPDWRWAGLLVVAVGSVLGVHSMIGGISLLESVRTEYVSQVTLYQRNPTTVIYVLAGVHFSTLATLWIFLSDPWSWSETTRTNTLAAYRQYLRHHGRLGRHEDAAKERMQGLLRASTERVRASRGGGDRYNIVVRILEHVLSKHLYLRPFPVWVRYSSSYVDAHERLHLVYPGFKIKRAAPAFSKRLRMLKEAEITREIEEAFAKLAPEHVLTFVTREPRGMSAALHIQYDVFTSGSLYYPKSEEGLPANDRTYFEGVSVRWCCRFLIDGRREQEFTLESNPEETLSVILSSDSFGVSDDVVYGEMASSAFRGFRRALVERFSLGVDAGTVT